MVKVKCKKCGTSGYSSSPKARCTCGGTCRDVEPKKVKSKKLEVV